jgi:DNA-binding response OmpR family regulator
MEKNKKMLIVEDDQPTSRVLSDRFSDEGFEVFQASEGTSGLKLAAKNKPDIILLDILMPKMDGLEMLKKLRSDKWGSGAKIVMLTNLSADEKILKAVLDYEPSGYLIKTDWTMDEIVKKVKNILK